MNNIQNRTSEREKLSAGKLTVFLGAAPGVGKTFSMLEAAREKYLEGQKVVIAVLNENNRVETNDLAQGIPQIPLKPIVYRGHGIEELDLDTVLSLKPELVVIDELAHTNIPGSRHSKRYQDVAELLAEGINVLTTLNIQHVESLNDIVYQITGLRIKETVPDNVLENAHQIVVVDLPPDELLQRIRDGKVLAEPNISAALHNFFEPGVLNALRELTLLYAARRVEKQMQLYMKKHGINGPWPTGERLMVCISPSPLSAQLVRTAKRMAEGLQAEWLAVYVETPKAFPIDDEAKINLEQNMRLAEELGAEVVHLTGNYLAEEIVELARQRNVSQIIIGKPLHKSLLQRINGSLVDKVIRLSHGISVHVITGETKEESPGKKKYRKFRLEKRYPYLVAVLMMVILTLLVSPFRNYLGLVNVAMIYLLPVLFCANRWGNGPAIIAAAVGVITYDFFFVPPRLSFTVADLRYLISFGIFILVAFLTGTLSSRLKNQAKYSRERERQVSALYSLSRDISAVASLNSILIKIADKVAETISGQVGIFMPSEGGRLVLKASSHEGGCFSEENDRVVAVWVFDHGQRAGKDTETLSAAKALFLPLNTEQGVQGVIAVCPDDGDRFQPNQLRLLEAFSVLAAVAINRAKLAEQARESLTYIESERLRTALFNSLSHDLRTPLASITGAVTGLIEGDNIFSPEARHDLLNSIQQGAIRMSRFINNLLEMAKMESGMMKLNKDWCDIQDLIGVSMKHIGESLGNRKIVADIPADTPLIKGDFILLEQVFVNLLDNAIKYSEDSSEIKVSARTNSDFIEIAVSNKGQLIPDEDLQNIFKKFYRLKTPLQVSGSGLGLSICKEIIEVHGGRMWAANNCNDGVDIKFTLPWMEFHDATSKGGDTEDGE